MTQLVLGPIKAIKRKLQIRYAQQQNKLARSKKSMFDGKGYNDRREAARKKNLERYRRLKKDLSVLKKKQIKALK